MFEEIELGVGFLARLFNHVLGQALFDFQRNDSQKFNFLCERYVADVDRFRQVLKGLLVEKYTGHWYINQPRRGQGYRCLLATGSGCDPVIEQAVLHSGLRYPSLARILCAITIWIDPGEVSYRIEGRRPTTREIAMQEANTLIQLNNNYSKITSEVNHVYDTIILFPKVDALYAPLPAQLGTVRNTTTKDSGNSVPTNETSEDAGNGAPKHSLSSTVSSAQIDNIVTAITHMNAASCGGELYTNSVINTANAAMSGVDDLFHDNTKSIPVQSNHVPLFVPTMEHNAYDMNTIANHANNSSSNNNFTNPGITYRNNPLMNVNLSNVDSFAPMPAGNTNANNRRQFTQHVPTVSQRLSRVHNTRPVKANSTGRKISSHLRKQRSLSLSDEILRSTQGNRSLRLLDESRKENRNTLKPDKGAVGRKTSKLDEFAAHYISGPAASASTTKKQTGVKSQTKGYCGYVESYPYYYKMGKLQRTAYTQRQLANTLHQYQQQMAIVSLAAAAQAAQTKTALSMVNGCLNGDNSQRIITGSNRSPVATVPADSSTASIVATVLATRMLLGQQQQQQVRAYSPASQEIANLFANNYYNSNGSSNLHSPIATPPAMTNTKYSHMINSTPGGLCRSASCIPLSSSNLSPHKHLVVAGGPNAGDVHLFDAVQMQNFPHSSLVGDPYLYRNM